jgi:hypothetical protein
MKESRYKEEQIIAVLTSINQEQLVRMDHRAENSSRNSSLGPLWARRLQSKCLFLRNNLVKIDNRTATFTRWKPKVQSLQRPRKNGHLERQLGWPFRFFRLSHHFHTTMQCPVEARGTLRAK